MKRALFACLSLALVTILSTACTDSGGGRVSDRPGERTPSASPSTYPPAPSRDPSAPTPAPSTSTDTATPPSSTGTK